MKNYSCSGWWIACGGTWMKALGKLAEFLLDYTAIAQAFANSMFARVSHLCILPPRGRRQQNTNTRTPPHTSKTRHICSGSKFSHRKPKVTQAVLVQSRLSLLSDIILALYNYFPQKSEAFYDSWGEWRMSETTETLPDWPLLEVLFDHSTCNNVMFLIEKQKHNA